MSKKILPYAFGLFSLLLSLQPITAQKMHHDKKAFDWQGHRGCRGLLPENSIPAFLKALEFPAITTLELDLAVSKDHELIISHEPWMSESICTKPDGTPVQKAEAMSLKIMALTYEEIKKYDSGSRGNARFPEQVKMKVHKPSLEDMVAAVREYCKMHDRPLPRFNIEIKSMPQGDSVFTPPIKDFVKLVLAELERLKIKELSCVQSFDVRPLQLIHEIDPSVTLAFLVENMDGVEKNLEKLGFTPQIYSCYYLLLRKKNVEALHEKGMQVIPWTVNSAKAMKKLIRWKVDGIITDYPNLIGTL